MTTHCVVEDTKVCNHCKVELPVSSFYVVKKRKTTVLWHRCKPCCSLTKPKNYSRDWELKKKYGITLDEYLFNSEQRDNKCDICSTQVKSLHVDHCHSSNKIRGYLCGSCNRGLGLFKDSTTSLNKAIEYLQEFKQ
jgi:hypothetical protein